MAGVYVSKPPSIIVDQKNNRTYRLGRYLGKGGFAHCYEVTDEATNQRFACKIMCQQFITFTHQKEKVILEILLHETMHHEHIVGFKSYFQDEANLYILLELCSNGTLSLLMQNRKTLQEVEAKHFLRQILMGVKYMHNMDILHRDIKAQNIFIHEDMTLKIGDFGLATYLDHLGEKKVTLCGTPNFIAPEILKRVGYSFGADIWSIGVILYVLLLGRCPFEAANLPTMYGLIKSASYQPIPDGKLSYEATDLLKKIFVVDTSKRLTLHGILQSDFMMKPPFIKSLPKAILTTAPIFKYKSNENKDPENGDDGGRLDKFS